MNFIVDENLPRQVAVWISATGHLASHVSELGLLGQSDNAVWTAACDRQACVVTRDVDFLTMTGNGTVIRLRIGNCATAVLLSRLEVLWPNAIARLAAGDRVVEIG